MYGINNNTGIGYSQQDNNFITKIIRSINSANSGGEKVKKISELINLIK